VLVQLYPLSGSIAPDQAYRLPNLEASDELVHSLGFATLDGSTDRGLWVDSSLCISTATSSEEEDINRRDEWYVPPPKPSPQTRALSQTQHPSLLRLTPYVAAEYPLSTRLLRAHKVSALQVREPSYTLTQLLPFTFAKRQPAGEYSPLS
jgi:hypothetical protein